MAQLLIQHGARVNNEDEDGQTPLHLAAEYGHPAVARVLIRHGADVDSKDRKGWTPLHVAAWYGHVNMTRLLIRNSADVNARDAKDRTPLHVHLLNRPSVDLCRILLDAGADVELKDSRGISPLSYVMSRKRQYPALVELFTPYTVQKTLLKDIASTQQNGEDVTHDHIASRKL